MNEAIDLVEHQAQASIVSVTAIHKRDGHNPRRIRSKSDRDSLRESIREKGVMQPILVRPHPEHDGQYELVAGETRFDLACEVGLTQIPALIRTIRDEELLSYAASENIHRAAMSPMDEGEVARKLLIKHKSDKESVCQELGWSRSKLDGRIQLTHCSTEVAQALADEQISIGHAQILSGLREDSQDRALEVVLEKRLSVDGLREKVESLSLRLNQAIFDTTECATCPHNSSVQASLFDAAAGDGRCLNKSCFDRKTDGALQTIKGDLSETYHRVEIDRDVAEGATTVLTPHGPSGVGEQQLGACTGCQHYGALVATEVGREGKVRGGVCFNLDCHGEKVKEYQAIIATDAAPAKASANDSAAPGPAQAGVTKTKPASKKKVASDATPKSILARNHQVHREAASDQVGQEARLVLIVSILSMISDSSVSFERTPQGWPNSLSGASRGKAAAILDQLSDAQLESLQSQIAAKMVLKATASYGDSNERDTFGSVAQWVSQSRQCDLSQKFVLDEHYLEPHTKPMIERVLRDAGFDFHYDTGEGDGAFKKLMAGKKGDIISAVKASDFNFQGFIPGSMRLDKPEGSPTLAPEMGDATLDSTETQPEGEAHESV